MRALIILIINSALMYNPGIKPEVPNTYFTPLIMQHKDEACKTETRKIDFSIEIQRKKIETDLLNQSA